MHIPYPRGTYFYIPKVLKKVIFHVLGGWAAETWFYGPDKTRYSGRDQWAAHDILLSYIGDREIARGYYWSLRREMIDWFFKPRYMNVVAALANALKEKPNMEGREVRKIIRSTGLKPLKKWA